MRRQKRLIQSYELIPGRDDKIISYFKRPDVSASGVTRAALNRYIEEEGGAGHSKILAELAEIKAILTAGGLPSPSPKAKEKFNDPFLDSAI